MSSSDLSRSSGKTSPVRATSPPGHAATFLRPSDPLSPATHATMLSSRRWPADEPRPVNLASTPTKRHEAVKIDASKKSELLGLDMTGFKIKVLTPNLTRFTFLTELRLGNNFITRLPPGIGLLRALAFLDMSNNYLTELPPEIGWLSCLKELLLFNNHLEDLPGELGYLYQLENLGIDGNPLNDSFVQVIQSQGALAIIPFLRDNMISSVPPADRLWHTVETYAASKCSITVACYNILCDKYATPQMFGYVPTWFLNWDYRKQMIMHELLSFDADIVCLQEVEANQFETYFKPQMRMRGGYEGAFSPKSRARTMSEWDRNYVDGCATFFKADRYKMEEKVLIEFNQMALSRPSLRKHKDMYNRVMTRDNIALVLRLNHKESRQEIIIGNVHIHWDPSFRDVKIVQTIMLAEELEKMLSQHPKSSMIVCGDFNSLPGSAVCTFLEEGSIPPNHPDFMGHTYEPYTSEGASSFLNLRNAYSIAPDPSPFTSFTPMFLGAIDYIWYRPIGLAVSGCLGTIPLDYTKQVVGLPSQHLPSDHVSLLAEFRLEGGGGGGSGKREGNGGPGVRYSTSNSDLAGSGSRLEAMQWRLMPARSGQGFQQSSSTMAPPKKGQKMSLGEFAQKVQSEGLQVLCVRRVGTVVAVDDTSASKHVSNWADEEFELPSAPLGQERSSYDMRPGRGPPERGYGRDEAPLPVNIDHSALPRVPPFLAFVANLPYDVTEDDLKSFFAGIAIKGIRFPRAGDSGPRGFGYVEFQSLEGLTEGLLRGGKPIKGRMCRVDLASQREEETKLPTGNWRDGHNVVESAARPERSALSRAPLPMAAPSGDWRATAKPIEAPVKPAAASQPFSLRAQDPKPAAKKPELKLLPRTLPVEDAGKLASDEYKKSSKPNPFGNAKPREIVLSEKDPKETL